MNRETNLYLRSILVREKSALIADRDNISMPAEAAIEKLDRINKEIKSINEGIGLLKSLPNEPTAPVEPPVEAPAPRLSDDTANRIRNVLETNVDALRDAAASVGAFLSLLPDDKILIQTRFDGFRLIEQARQDLNEFNEVFPKK